jgi:hypothetical protein
LAHVGRQGVRPGFAPATGFLLSAERPADLRSGRADVDIGDFAVGFGQEPLRLAQVGGEDGGRKTLRHRVIECDRIVEFS